MATKSTTLSFRVDTRKKSIEPPGMATSRTTCSSFPGSCSVRRCRQSRNICLRSKSLFGQIMTPRLARPWDTLQVPIVTSGWLFRIFEQRRPVKGQCCESTIHSHFVSSPRVEEPYSSKTCFTTTSYNESQPSGCTLRKCQSLLIFFLTCEQPRRLYPSRKMDQELCLQEDR